MTDRLFVPLAKGPFEWFRDGAKRFELRRYGRQFTERYARSGRSVELRKGYSGESLFGIVGRVVVSNSLDDLFAAADGFIHVIPVAKSLEQARTIAEQFCGTAGPYILFEVLLQKGASAGSE